MNTQRYTVNVRVGGIGSPRVAVSQGDIGRRLVFNLFDGAVAFAVTSGTTVTIVGRKPSGLGFDEECTHDGGNSVSVRTTEAMTQEAGKIPAELRISDGTKVIGTANFVFYVEPSPHPDGTTDGTLETMDDIQTQIGDLSDLTTSEKSSLVGAINEAAQSGGSEVVIDATLTQSGQAADAKATGDEIGAIKADLSDLEDRVEDLEESGSGGGSGVPTSVRSAMLALFQAGTYTGDVSSYIATISSWASEISGISVSPTTASISGSSTTQLVATTTPAGGTVTWESSNTAVATVSSSGLVTGIGNGTATITARCGSYHASCAVTVSGFATLTGISAVYTQSGTVYEDTSLNSLKNDLVVTAHYDNSTTATVTDYTLSGSLSVGTSTIVVAYGGKTTTFDVTVTWSELPSGYTEKGYIYRTVGENSWTDGLSKLIKTDTVENVSDLTFEFAVMPLATIASSATIIGAGSYLANEQTYLRGVTFFADTSRKRVSCYSHATAMGVNDISTLAVGEKTNVRLVPGTESPAKLYINGELSTSANWTKTTSYSAPVSLHTYIGERNIGATKTKATPNLAVGAISLYDSSDNLVAKYIPCVRNTDSVIGLYDSVGRVFYTAETVSYATIGDSNCVYAVGDWEE